MLVVGEDRLTVLLKSPSLAGNLYSYDFTVFSVLLLLERQMRSEMFQIKAH